MMETPDGQSTDDVNDDLLPSLLVEAFSPKTIGLEGNDEHSFSASTSGRKYSNIEVFKSYLDKAGIHPTALLERARFNKLVDLIFERMYNEAAHCVSSAGALALYNMAETFATDETKAKYRSEDIVLEEPLQHAHSHKAYFLRVFVEGVPKVFKYPQSDDNSYFVKSVQKDIQFCEYLKNDKEVKEDDVLSCMKGIVEYAPFSYVTTDGVSVSGSISNIYTCSLAEIKSPFPPQRIFLICQHILATISRIHAKGLSINDIKLSNLYMDFHGQIDIADFGACCEIGDIFSEYTVNVIPVEFARRGTAWPSVDRMCLVSCILTLLGLSWTGKPTVAKYRLLVETAVEHVELKELLLSLFSSTAF